MKNVYALVDRAVAECVALNIPVGYIDDITVNYRAKSRWGQCRKRRATGRYVIEINAELLRDDVDDMATMDTVVHEVLHTCEGCMNHGTLWKRYANMVNRAYGYNIKRTTSAEAKGLESRTKTAKYVVTCDGCGHKYGFARETKTIKIIRGNIGGTCRCSCGCTHFTVAENY